MNKVDTYFIRKKTRGARIMVGQKFHLGYLSRCQVGESERGVVTGQPAFGAAVAATAQSLYHTKAARRANQYLSWEAHATPAAGESTWLHAAEAKIMLCVDRCVLVVVDAVRCSA